MKAVFINSSEPACGVHQYGVNLYSVLEYSKDVDWFYCEPASESELKMAVDVIEPDFCVVNFQALIGGYLASAPFPWMKNPVLVYHDCDIDESRWRAILFSDPTMPPKSKWHSIGRPIPTVSNPLCLPNFQSVSQHWIHPVIGVYGFLGAWADQVVSRVINEFEYATIALSFPFSKFCDPNGDAARGMAERCRQMTNGTAIVLQITHDFMDRDQLIAWLARNDLNCFFRPVEMAWRGVSSAPDFALAARKPIAVNDCDAFRHLHNTNPSICVEDIPLQEIIRNGLSPLVPLYVKWAPEEVRKQVESVLMSL